MSHLIIDLETHKKIIINLFYQNYIISQIATVLNREYNIKIEFYIIVNCL